MENTSSGVNDGPHETEPSPGDAGSPPNGVEHCPACGHLMVLVYETVFDAYSMSEHVWEVQQCNVCGLIYEEVRV